MVDHVLHAVGTVVAPASGAILFTGQTGLETDLPTLAAVLLGGVTAGSIHAGRSRVRPASTATTGGLGNPVLSFGEDVGSLILVVTAFVAPLLALLLVVLLGGLARESLAAIPSRSRFPASPEPTAATLPRLMLRPFLGALLRARSSA